MMSAVDARDPYPRIIPSRPCACIDTDATVALEEVRTLSVAFLATYREERHRAEEAAQDYVLSVLAACCGHRTRDAA